MSNMLQDSVRASPSSVAGAVRGGTPVMRDELRVAVSSDADDHARNLSRWHQEYDQFSAGVFSGKIAELWLPDLQLFIESTSQALHQTCVAWPDALWFGIPVSRKDKASIGAAQIPHDSVAIRPGGTEFELWTPVDFDILGIVVQEEAFARYAQDVEHVDGYSLLRQYKVAGVSPQAKESVTQALLNMLHRVEMPQPGHDTASTHRILQDQVLMHLVSLLMTTTAPETRVTTTFLHRRRIVRKVREYILEHPDENVSIPQLCRLFHVSRRTLQYCFEDVVGMSPVAYLRTVRLNEVRRRLFFGGRYGQVTEVAMSWGFRHLSQFSIDYQKLFGVLPSETVRGEYCEALASGRGVSAPRSYSS